MGLRLTTEFTSRGTVDIFLSSLQLSATSLFILSRVGLLVAHLQMLRVGTLGSVGILRLCYNLLTKLLGVYLIYLRRVMSLLMSEKEGGITPASRLLLNLLLMLRLLLHHLHVKLSICLRIRIILLFCGPILLGRIRQVLRDWRY